LKLQGEGGLTGPQQTVTGGVLVPAMSWAWQRHPCLALLQPHLCPYVLLSSTRICAGNWCQRTAYSSPAHRWPGPSQQLSTLPLPENRARCRKRPGEGCSQAPFRLLPIVVCTTALTLQGKRFRTNTRLETLKAHQGKWLTRQSTQSLK